MHEEPIKICSKCGGEYSLEASTCADCGGALVFSQNYVKPSVPLEESSPNVLVRQGAVDYLRELAKQLNKTGIRTDIRFHGGEPGT